MTPPPPYLSVLVLYTNYCQMIHLLELRQYYGVMKSKFLYSLIAGSRDGGEQWRKIFSKLSVTL